MEEILPIGFIVYIIANIIFALYRRSRRKVNPPVIPPRAPREGETRPFPEPADPVDWEAVEDAPVPSVPEEWAGEPAVPVFEAARETETVGSFDAPGVGDEAPADRDILEIPPDRDERDVLEDGRRTRRRRSLPWRRLADAPHVAVKSEAMKDLIILSELLGPPRAFRPYSPVPGRRRP